MSRPNLLATVAQAVKDSRPHTHCLAYRPGTPMGEKFPLWRWGYRRSAESCEASRMQCANRDQIEVVEVGE